MPSLSPLEKQPDSHPGSLKSACAYIASCTLCVTAGMLPACTCPTALPPLLRKPVLSHLLTCLASSVRAPSHLLKSCSSFPVDKDHLLPGASLAFLPFLGKIQLSLLKAPPLVLVVVSLVPPPPHTLSPLGLNWFCQHRTTRPGAPPASLSLLHVSSQGLAPLCCGGLRTPFAEGREVGS